ncbi:hypothetical protein BD626DRAFT_474840 [Schizophyllum amplum]|uniref:Uncharacterized protein n=1 Tax=Schizophyllum amplum TaxID=97359 RepID=A0A550CXV8_9AGAR|nr:hypothetical protein BD626DRAFT_474840 [Auriculariopsis ampla]
MEQEGGDEYIRRKAAFIRTHDKRLAQSPFFRRPRRRTQHAPSSSLSAINPLAWFAAPDPAAPPPLVFDIDTHHLFYLLMRMEALGIDVGNLDVAVDNPSRPMSYINFFNGADKSDTLSLASFRSSLSTMSGLSLGPGWWGRPEPPTIDAELKFIYSCFTKLPALSVTAPSRKVITELANEAPNTNAIPLDAFKNLYALECTDVDPRALLGWDRLAESLRSLKIKKSGLEDASDIFIGAVVDDQARREGSVSRKRHRRISRGPSRQPSFATRLPESVPEAVEEEGEDVPLSTSPEPVLSSLKWAFLKHLCLAENALTFFPADSLPHLTALTHLDLSSNLLVSIPTGLGALYNLVSLNLSDNMVDSVLHIYQNLGQVLYLNLSRNRLESLCGLERLPALERLDLRENLIEESAEVGRLVTLPNIQDVAIEGNLFTEYEENYRVACFDCFWKEGKTITLDGTPPSFYERRSLSTSPAKQMTSARPPSMAASPPVVAVASPPMDAAPSPPTSVQQQSPSLQAVAGRARKKRAKRIVQLDGENGSDVDSAREQSQARNKSDASEVAGDAERTDGPSTRKQVKVPRPSPPSPPTAPQRTRHSRHQTEVVGSWADEEGSAPTKFVESRRKGGSQTLSGRAAARRSRVSASVFEPPRREDSGERGEEGEDFDGEAYRRKIEALKKDMGDGWLKAFSQSQAVS